MTTNSTARQSTPSTADASPTADEWSSAPERRYAECQADLAARYDLAVDSRTVETDSAGRVHYLVAGDPDGEPVVLLHGVSTTAATWLPLVGVLADHYRVYIPDRPGRGLSAPVNYRGRYLRSFLVDYLADLCVAESLDRPHAVGNSLGGLQALLLAIDRDRVDRLCLVGAPAGISAEFSLAWRLLTARGLNRLLLWLQHRGDPMANARATVGGQLVVDDSAVPDVFYRLMAARQGSPPHEWSLRSLLSAEGSYGRMHPVFDIREEVVDIDRPTAFVWGNEDAFWPPAVGRPVAESMTDAEFHALPNHGHMPWLEPGDEAETRVRSFLDGRG